MGVARPVTRSRPSPRSRASLRAVSGVLAGGLVVLAVALGVAWVVATRTGSAGPRPGFLFWHGCAAVAAVGLQLRADRAPARRMAGRDVGGIVAALAVVAISAVVLAALWLS